MSSFDLGRSRSHALFTPMLFAALISNALIFGFFYAWICSTMWGLDMADPRVAIQSMQAMNASVRNIVFGPVFFGTPILLGFAGFIGRRAGYRRTSMLLIGSAVICALGYLVLTGTINVPMNNALGEVTVPTDKAAAMQIWQDYSSDWQFWNTTRTIFSGIGFVVALYAAIIVLPVERR